MGIFLRAGAVFSAFGIGFSICCRPTIQSLPVETRVAVINFSKDTYVTVRLREHSPDGDGEWSNPIPLLPPGAAFRAGFYDVIGTLCPSSLDMQLFHFERVHSDLPIGEDDGEMVNPSPVLAAEITDVPACGVRPVVDYTIANWEANRGTARVKFAQGTDVDEFIRSSGRFFPPDYAWEPPNIVDRLSIAPPALADAEPIAGKVESVDRTAAAGVGVIIRTKIRLSLTEFEFSSPIDYTQTNGEGEFELSRPRGAYRVEFFADEHCFRPGYMDIEAPISDILAVAEAPSEACVPLR